MVNKTVALGTHTKSISFYDGFVACYCALSSQLGRRLIQKGKTMKSLKFLAASIAALGVVGSAQAGEGQVYGAIGVETIEFDSYNATAKLGYEFTENFAVEGQAGFGIIDDEVSGVDVGVDTNFAAFGVAKAPISDNINLFGRGGYHFTQIGVSNGGTSVGVDTDGFAAGAGLEYMFNAKSGIRAEYTYYDIGYDFNGTDYSEDANSVAVSYLMKF